MSDDTIIMHCDKGESRGKITIIAQGIDKPCFTILRKGIVMHIEYIRYIERCFRADKKRSHHFLYES
jgi:hypothetical protein